MEAAGEPPPGDAGPEQEVSGQQSHGLYFALVPGVDVDAAGVGLIPIGSTTWLTCSMWPPSRKPRSAPILRYVR